MNVSTFLVVLLWGLFCGYAMVKLLEVLINALSALHGIFLRRWRWLANKAAPGQIHYDILTNLLIRMLVQGGIILLLLNWGDGWVRSNVVWRYQGLGFQIWCVAGFVAAAVTLRLSLKRIKISWKISHEVGYAQKRKRTLFIRS